jgi:hypothetical protein
MTGSSSHYAPLQDRPVIMMQTAETSVQPKVPCSSNPLVIADAELPAVFSCHGIRGDLTGYER